ncbi:hypothetical protein [Streptomyces sp. NPDC051014]|uniref:hypothetical protein n=1 Tax=Streptomyces sp. NPDC051014 TaxID=3155751 RepID=UPI0033EF96D3
MSRVEEITETSFNILFSALERLRQLSLIPGAEHPGNAFSHEGEAIQREDIPESAAEDTWEKLLFAALREAGDDRLQGQFLRFSFAQSEGDFVDLKKAVFSYLQGPDGYTLPVETFYSLHSFCLHHAIVWVELTDQGKDGQRSYEDQLMHLMDSEGVSGVFAYPGDPGDPEDPDGRYWNGEWENEAKQAAKAETAAAVAALRARSAEISRANRRALSGKYEYPNMPLYFIQHLAFTGGFSDDPGIVLVSPQGDAADEVSKVTRTVQYCVFTAYVNVQRRNRGKVIVITGAPSHDNLQQEIREVLLECGTDKEIVFDDSMPPRRTAAQVNDEKFDGQGVLRALRAQIDDVNTANRYALSSEYAYPDMPLHFIQGLADEEGPSDASGIVIVCPQADLAEALRKIGPEDNLAISTTRVNVRRKRGRKAIIISGAESAHQEGIRAALLQCGTEKEVVFDDSERPVPQGDASVSGTKQVRFL